MKLQMLMTLAFAFVVIDTSMAQNSTSATNATANATSPAPSGPTVTNATTVTMTTPATTEAPGSTTTLLLFFSSNETFTSDLADSNSNAFKARVILTKAVIEPVYRRAYASFLRLVVLRFRRGSIVTDAELVFNSSGTVPSASEAAKTLQDAAANLNSSFSVIANSVNVTISLTATTVAATTSGVSPVAGSVFTCFMVTLASILLTSVFRFS